MSFRPISSEGLFNSISRLRVQKKGEDISLVQLYEEIYEGLDPLFDASVRDIGDETLGEKERKALVHKWKEGLERKRLSAIGEVEINDQVQEVELEVYPRTNFPLERDRRPSIFQLRDKSGNVVYARIARHYSPLGHPQFRDMDFNCATTNDPRTLARGDRIVVDGASWYSKFYMGRKERLKRNLPSRNMRDKSPLIFVPEPHLLRVLESFYADGVPRVTPRMKVLETTYKDIVLIRPHLQQALDVSIDKRIAEGLGDYFGVMHALGLLDTYDRQLEHYVLQQRVLTDEGRRIVNYDLDFVLLDRRPKRSRAYNMGMDARAFKEMLGRSYPMLSRRDFEAFDSARKETMAKVVELIGRDRIDNEFYDRLRTNLNDYTQK